MYIIKLAFAIRTIFWEVFTVDYEQLVKDQELVNEYIRSVGGNRDVDPICDGVVDPRINAEASLFHQYVPEGRLSV